MTLNFEPGSPPDPSTFDDLDDVSLLQLSREGDSSAYAELYQRYFYAARRLARHLGQREESDDVVSESFAQIYDLLQRGKGPDREFRAYLFTTIRHESGRRAKAGKRVFPTDDAAQIDSAVPFVDGAVQGFERSAVRAAYESLPERWQTVLWHLEVEGRRPHEVAESMGLKANSVSALVYRARSGLRDAYLQQHVNTPEEVAPGCRDLRETLAGVVRGTASARAQEKAFEHLAGCSGCAEVYRDLKDANYEVGGAAGSTPTPAAPVPPLTLAG